MKRILLALALVAGLIAGNAIAQSSGSVQAQTPLTRDIGAIQTFSSSTANTYNSADQSGFNVSRVICAFNTTSRTGTPTATVAIQNKDAASGAYYSLITSSSISSNTTTTVAAGAGLPAVANVSGALPIARTWRTQVVISGTTSYNGTVGCSLQ